MQLARQIWFRRNKWAFDGVFTSPNVIIQKSFELIADYSHLHEKRSPGHSMRNPDCVKKWRAPSQGWYKANWDVAIDKSHGQVGIGVVIREEKGQVIAAMSKTRMSLLEPTTGEAYAAYHAACLCKDVGVQNILLEGDAKQIVEAINSHTRTWSHFGHLISDTRRILPSF